MPFHSHSHSVSQPIIMCCGNVHLPNSVSCVFVCACMLFHRSRILAYLATIFIGSSFQVNSKYILFPFRFTFAHSVVSFCLLTFFSSSSAVLCVQRRVHSSFNVYEYTTCRQLCSLFLYIGVLPYECLCVSVCMCVGTWNASKINLVETSQKKKMRKNCFKCATTKIVAREIHFIQSEQIECAESEREKGRSPMSRRKYFVKWKNKRTEFFFHMYEIEWANEWRSQKQKKKKKATSREKNIHRYSKRVSEWVVLGYISLQFNRCRCRCRRLRFAIYRYTLYPLPLFQQREKYTHRIHHTYTLRYLYAIVYTLQSTDIVYLYYSSYLCGIRIAHILEWIELYGNFLTQLFFEEETLKKFKKNVPPSFRVTCDFRKLL